MHPILTAVLGYAITVAALLVLGVAVGRRLRHQQPPACPHPAAMRNGFGFRICTACRVPLPEPGGEPVCGPEGCALPVAHARGCVHTGADRG